MHVVDRAPCISIRDLLQGACQLKQALDIVENLGRGDEGNLSYLSLGASTDKFRIHAVVQV